MEIASDTLAGRLRILIDACTDKRGKFAQLEKLTNISAENWKSFYYSRQRPNPDMIEALAQLWPEYALWIALGETDKDYGHLSPLDSTYTVNAREYLKSLINSRNVARNILKNKYEISDLGEPLPERIQSTIEKYISSAHHLIDPVDDNNGEFRAALEKLRIENEKRKIEVSRLSPTTRGVIDAIRAYPYIDKNSLQEAINKLLENAELEKEKNG
ncbi:hypothetical protein ACO0K7_18860 [Undibacterium sp. Ji67W]|uniref:hypothetical protein n=1 Tax=Undibacterium sp. Ji67W TaxID=3413042 RepID=UPI003BF110C9